MKLLSVLFVVLLAGGASCYAGTSIDVRNSDGTIDPLEGSSGQPTITLLSAEDQPNSVFRVEGQFSYLAPVAVDTPVKNAPGYVHVMKCSATDAAAVAGTIQLRNSLSAGTGDVVEEWTVLLADYSIHVPKTFIVDKVFGTGIYLDFTTTTDVKCDVSFR